MVGMSSGHVMKIQRAERILLAIGLTLLAIWGGARFHSALASRAAIARFQAQNATSAAPRLSPALDPILSSKVDFRLWSIKRIEAYQDSLTKKTDLPLGILRIPKIDLEVPVFNDTDDLTLNRGVGRILGTARVGQPGNLCIAGHRDGFFRGLKDIGPGDTIELMLPHRTDHYSVTSIMITNPDDVRVLEPTSTASLTLVTCYPFYFVGSAPRRYIVQASLEEPAFL